MTGISGMEAARELRKRKDRAILIFITALEEYVFQAFDVGAFHYLVKPFTEEKFAAVLGAAAEQYREREAVVFNRKVVLHRLGGDIEYYGRISELERLAGADFFRTHRAYLVNFNYVLQYNAGTVWLEGGGRALIAKKKFSEFVKLYLKFNALTGMNQSDGRRKG